jgi:hypothetical protein
VQLSDNPSMSALLTRLRGAPVEIQTDKETLQGTVLSIETREEAASEVVVKRAYVNLMTNPRDALRAAGHNYKPARARTNGCNRRFRTRWRRLARGWTTRARPSSCALRGRARGACWSAT